MSRYALQYQMDIFVNYDGVTYDFMTNSTSLEGSDASLQENVTSYWISPSDGQDIDLSNLQDDFYTKTNSQLSSGSHFDMADGKSCYLLLFATFQPVNEAKEVVIVFLPFTLRLSLLLAVIFAPAVFQNNNEPPI